MNERIVRRQRLRAAAMVEPYQTALFDLVDALLKEGVEPYDLVEDVESIRKSENLSEHEDDKFLDVLDQFVGYAGAIQRFISLEEKMALIERWNNQDG